MSTRLSSTLPDDVFYRIRLQPKLECRPADPSFTMSTRQAGAGRELCFPLCDCDHLRMVEPDGIEPTTSCLQSTRSTN